MYAKFCVNREAANNFMRLFVNRRAYAIQAERPLPNGSVPYYPARDWKTKEPKPLDEGVVRMHLNGDITISLYAINPETQRSKWVAIDADFDGSLESLFQLQWELKQDGVDAALEQSRRGGHLWIFGAEPLLASECRIYVYNLALRLGIPVKGGGLKEGIEVFPRQDRLEDGELGNAIRAPLGVHRKTNRRYWFYEAEPTPEAQLAYLDGLKKLTEAELRTFIEGMSLPEAYRPVVAAPYTPPASSSQYPEFRILDYVRTTRKDSRNWWARCPVLRGSRARPLRRQPCHPDQEPALLQMLGRLHERGDSGRAWPAHPHARGGLGSEYEGRPRKTEARIRLIAPCSPRARASGQRAQGAPEARHLLHPRNLTGTPAPGQTVCAARRGVRRRGLRHGQGVRFRFA